MGESSGTGSGPSNGGAGGGGDIDWSAVFNGLATATAAQTPFPRPLVQQDQSAHEEAYNNTSSTSVWDHLFPPPIPPGIGRTEPLSTSSTPRSVEAGPSRPRTTGNMQSFSAPITPNPQYTNQTDFFARLSNSMYGFDDQQQQHPAALGQDISTVPRPARSESLAPLDLEERLRKNHGNTSINQARHEVSQDTSQWQDSSAVTSNMAFALPSPHPSFARTNPPARSQSLSSWQNLPVPGPSNQRGSFTPPDGPGVSSESTPTAGLPPGTPLQPVADLTPGGALDTEDKRQRNTLASAKFRAKRKKHMANISQRITELEGEQTSLTRDVADLKQENKFLREMVEIKYGLEAKSSSDSKPVANNNAGRGVTARSPSQSPGSIPSPTAPRRAPGASRMSPPRPQHPRRPAPLELQSQSSSHAQPSIPSSLHHHNQSHLGYTYSPLDQSTLTGGISSASTLSSLLDAHGEWETYQSQYDTSLQDNVNLFQSPENGFIEQNQVVEQNQVDESGALPHGSLPLSNHTTTYSYPQSHRPS